MPGLEIKYDLVEEEPPLVRVREKANSAPEVAVEQSLAGLTLLGYDWTPSGGDIQVRLYWQVDEPLRADYTTSVQVFDASGSRLAQSDRPPGGVYFPTSLWKPGEYLIEEHLLTPDKPIPVEGVLLQVGMYAGASLEQVADPLRIQLGSAAVE